VQVRQIAKELVDHKKVNFQPTLK